MENEFQAPEQPLTDPVPGAMPGAAPSISPEKLPGFFNLIEKSWFIFKKRFSTLITVLLAGLLLIIASAGIFFLLGLIPMLFVSKISALIIAMFLAGTAGLTALILLQWALVIAVVAPDSKTKDCYLRAWSKFGPLLWLFTLLSLIVVGGFFLLIIPGILFSVWFMFAIYIFMAEDIHGMEALARSRFYVQGRWFGVFWRIALFFIITSIISNIPIIGWLITPAVFLLQVVFLYVVYHELKATRGDLMYAPNPKFNKIAIIVGVIGTLYIPILAVIFSGPVLVRDFGTFSHTLTGKYLFAPVSRDFEYVSGKGIPQIHVSGKAVDSAGNTYIIDSKDNSINKFNPLNNLIEKWTGTESTAGKEPFVSPNNIVLDSKGNIYIAEPYRIQKFNSSGKLLSKWVSDIYSGTKRYFVTGGIALDKNDTLYVLDIQKNRVMKAKTTVPPAVETMAAIEKIPQTGYLFGTVVNKRKKAVGGVNITVVRGEWVKYKTVTDSEGIFSTGELPFGTYEIQLAKKGYRKTVKAVELTKEPAENQFILKR